MLEAKQRRLQERKRKKSRTAGAHAEENQYSDLDESDEEDVANPRVVSLQDEPPNRSAWADFTEIFRNPPSVSPDSPEGSSTMDTPEKASHRSSAQDSDVDDDWL
mmetsp:Transcript_3647/g.8375  ORF Transcript_3647/g.8375 Transcript_3647/m.8375 type:complete len:105 (-) Transcript_3647:1477-1791(-)